MIWLANNDVLTNNRIIIINNKKINNVKINSERLMDKIRSYYLSDKNPYFRVVSNIEIKNPYKITGCITSSNNLDNTSEGLKLSDLIPQETDLEKLKKFNNAMKDTDYYEETFGGKYPDLFCFMQLLDCIEFKIEISYSIKHLEKLKQECEKLRINTDIIDIQQNIPLAFKNQKILSFVNVLKDKKEII
jgi:hypothetical protein